MVLEAIIASKRAAVAGRGGRPLRDLAPSDRSLEDALRRPRTGFILECKRASPSRGLIRDRFDPAAIARTYSEHADAISVLAEERFFGGGLEHVRLAREATHLPVLCKDFVLEPFQVREARLHGADAVLLMLSVLDDAAFVSCFEAARTLEMDVLAEVRDEDELARALDLGARIIGINNRDLSTLEVDPRVTEALAPLVPPDRVVVSESGIRDHADVRRLRPLVDGMLVGTALMRRADLARAVRELVHGSVKVCGLTRPGDARGAMEAGATHGGLVFAPASARRVDPGSAREVVEGAGLAYVGVFVDESPGRVASLAAGLDLAAVQLHGDETQRYVGELRTLLPAGCEVWKAVRVGDRVPHLGRAGADRILLDTHVRGARGGTGRTFDWTLIEGRDLGHVVLGGGLDPGNAAAADGLGCSALDVSSGVEEAPGRKSRTLLDSFFAALRGTRGRSS